MSCLNEKEKVELMDMLYKYKEAFSLRDEIGTCPNIEVEIEVTDRSPFFIRPYHVREEDKVFMDKGNEKIMLHGYLKRGIFSLFKPSDAHKQKIDKRQEGSHRFQTFKCENSQKQLGIPISQRHLLNTGKLKV